MCVSGPLRGGFLVILQNSASIILLRLPLLSPYALLLSRLYFRQFAPHLLLTHEGIFVWVIILALASSRRCLRALDLGFPGSRGHEICHFCHVSPACSYSFSDLLWLMIVIKSVDELSTCDYDYRISWRISDLGHVRRIHWADVELEGHEVACALRQSELIDLFFSNSTWSFTFDLFIVVDYIVCVDRGLGYLMPFSNLKIIHCCSGGLQWR